MSDLGDRSLDHLRRVADWPQLESDRYELIELLGQGGMGTVYRAHDRELDRDVALKILRSTEHSEDLQRRLRREARVLARLEHPGIVPVHDVGLCADGRSWYVMKLVDGDSLDEACVKLDNDRDRIRLLERVCDAVAFAHSRSVLHRDLKPSNVMVGAFGEVLVLDWGVAKILDETDIEPPAPDAPTTYLAPEQTGSADATQAGTILGTPGFMSPEQAAGRLDLVDRRSDIYSLGAILRATMRGASKPLIAIAAKACATDPTHRYGSVESFALDLRRHLDGASVSAYREPFHELLLRFAKRHSTVLLLFAAYLLMRALVGFFLRT